VTPTRGIYAMLLAGALALGGCWHPGGGEVGATSAAVDVSADAQARDPHARLVHVGRAVAPAALPDVGGCEDASLDARTVEPVADVADLYLVRGDDGAACIDTRETIQRRLAITLDVANSDPMPGIDPAASGSSGGGAASSDPMPGDNNDGPKYASSDPMPGHTK
jgi:hypothetical protein